jgi:uncharacterized membrane protein
MYRLTTLFAALGALAISPVSHAQLYTYAIESMNAEDLGTFGGQNSEVVDVNHLGDMVGWAEYANGRRHALLMRNTGDEIEDFTLGMDTHTYANGINDVMEVVGYSESTPGSAHARAIYRVDGQPLKFLQPFFDYSIAYAINGQGMVAGVKSGPLPNIPGSPCVGLMPLRWLATSNWYDTLWCASGQMALRATDINNLNLIVGWSNQASPNPPYAWTWSEGTLTLVPQPASPACGMRALGVNNTGTVVGFASLCSGGVLPRIRRAQSRVHLSQALRDEGAADPNGLYGFPHELRGQRPGRTPGCLGNHPHRG